MPVEALPGEAQKVFLGVFSRDATNHMAFTRSLVNTVYEALLHKIVIELHTLEGNCHVDDCHNEVVAAFLRSGCDDLVIIGSDQGWEPADFVRLCQHDRDIVAAAVRKKQDEEKYTILMGQEDDDCIRVTPDGLVIPFTIGSGFLRIRRRALEIITDQCEWFLNQHREMVPLLFERKVQHYQRWGCDNVFCFKAKEAGFQLYVDPEIGSEHVGPKRWSGKLGDYWRRENGIEAPAVHTRRKRVLFLAEQDFAGNGAGYARALRTQGVEVLGFAAAEHPFLYPEQFTSGIPQDEELSKLIEWADVVTLVQSTLPARLMNGSSLEWLDRLSRRPVVMTHGGSAYRADPGACVQAFGSIVRASICAEADLMGHFGEEVLVLPPVDTALLKPKAREGGLRIGHFPSNPAVKGTAQIASALQDTSFDYKIDAERLPWPIQIHRMGRCDVIIDQIYAPIGEWVTTSLEAAALGAIPIANSHRPERYTQAYGRPAGIHVCNTVEEMLIELARLEVLTRADLDAERNAARAWVEECHTFARTGEILMDRVYRALL